MVGHGVGVGYRGAFGKGQGTQGKGLLSELGACLVSVSLGSGGGSGCRWPRSAYCWIARRRVRGRRESLLSCRRESLRRKVRSGEL